MCLKGLGPLYFILYGSPITILGSNLPCPSSKISFWRLKPSLHPTSSLTAFAQATNFFLFKTEQGCGKRRLKSRAWPWAANPVIQTHNSSSSLQTAGFPPPDVSLSSQLCPVITGRAGWIPGPLPIMGLCFSLQQGQCFTPLSASAAGLVLLAFYIPQLNVSIWLFLQQYSFRSYSDLLSDDLILGLHK